MASNHEVQLDGVVQTCEHSPHEVLHHGVLLVLATAVVSMQTGGGFAEAMMAEVIVQQTDNCVRSFTGLINNEVHLARNSLAADSKDGGLPRC